MAAQKDNPYRLMWMLGLTLTLPMILLSGPLAGYLIGSLLVNKFSFSKLLVPALMVLGLIASGMQSYQLIRKLNTKE